MRAGLLRQSCPHRAYAHLGSFSCRRHHIKYSVEYAVDEQQIIDLGNISGVGNYTTTCNLDESAIVVQFSEETYAQAFMNFVFEYVQVSRNALDPSISMRCRCLASHIRLARLQMAGNDLFLTAVGPYGCPVAKNSTNGILLRRLVADPAVLDGSDGKGITLTTAQANYNDVYSSADISYTTAPDQGGWNMCIGLNADPTTCMQAAGPITIYSSEVVDVSCENCFAGFHANVFFDLSIKDFLLRRLAGGFRNLSVAAGIGLDLNAHVQKPILSVDKQLLHLGGADHPVLSFRIGSIPFALWFESQMGFHGDLQLGAQAQADAGVQMQYLIGDNYVEWDEGKGWSHLKPDPSLNFTPELSAEANFALTANMGLTSEISMHINQIFTHTISLNPSVNAAITGDLFKRQLCLTSSYDAELVTQASLHMSILWKLVHVDATFGPKTLWSRQSTLPKKCVSPKGSVED